MKFETPLNLDLIIKAQVDSLPRWCRGEGDDFESHEWVPTYGYYKPFPDGVKDMWALDEASTKEKKYYITNAPISGPTHMYPYFLCKHCHAVSSNFTTTPPDQIKRVR